MKDEKFITLFNPVCDINEYLYYLPPPPAYAQDKVVFENPTLLNSNIISETIGVNDASPHEKIYSFFVGPGRLNVITEVEAGNYNVLDNLMTCDCFLVDKYNQNLLPPFSVQSQSFGKIKRATHTIDINKKSRVFMRVKSRCSGYGGAYRIIFDGAFSCD